MDYFIYGNVDTRNYNVHIFPLEIDGAPEVTQQKIVIPGKHGSLLHVDRRMENVTHRYMGVIYQDAEAKLIAFRNAIMKYSGYTKLTDSIHDDEFYLANYAGGLEPELAMGRDMIKFIIEFDRKPQRYLVSGDTPQTLTSSTSYLSNPTDQPSEPLIRVYGYGNLRVGSKSITITSHSRSYIDIDCEMKDCYYGSVNCNGLVSLPNYEFPKLGTGSTSIGKDSNISQVVVTPRWWRV